jgi:diacylglycerol kinase family enzyme
MAKFRRNPIVPNKFAYIGGIISSLVEEYGAKFRITIDDEKLECEEFLLAAFGKGSYYGGGFKALPLAVADDGYLDACIARKIPRTSFIKCVGKYKQGNHIGLDFITYKKCRKILIECDEPIGVSADGEVTLETALDIEVMPLALSFSVPDGCAFELPAEIPAEDEENTEFETAETEIVIETIAIGENEDEDVPAEAADAPADDTAKENEYQEVI